MVGSDQTENFYIYSAVTHTHTHFFAPASTNVTMRIPPQLSSEAGRASAKILVHSFLHPSACVCPFGFLRFTCPFFIWWCFHLKVRFLRSCAISRSRSWCPFSEKLSCPYGFQWGRAFTCFLFCRHFPCTVVAWLEPTVHGLNKTFKGCWISEARPLKVTHGRHEAQPLIGHADT